MHLHDNLQVCLLALASRYPESLIENNSDVIGAHASYPGCRTTQETIIWLQRTEPALLKEKASLVIDEQRHVIYLTDRNDQTPAYRIHYRGKMSAHTETNNNLPAET